MSNSEPSYLIRGPPTKDRQRPPVRMEVRDMLKEQPQMWELYLLGLQRFQKVDKLSKKGINEPMSWYQIAGIHGKPYGKWPSDKDWSANIPEVDDSNGFCTHSSILFLPWHRPYLALFESQLYGHVQEVAKDFVSHKDAALYAQAATNFRIPYWDWAAQDRSTFPLEALQSTAPVKLIANSKLEHNPLAWYNFSDAVGQELRIGNYKRTVRYAPNPSKAGDEKQIEAINDFFNSPKPGMKGNNLTERTMFVLQSYKRFGPMSNNAIMSSQEKQSRFEYYGSLEDSHNSIHGLTGGAGQMSNPAVAAFDPIFWLHHTNIDRLFAIWQALHDDTDDPDTWVKPTQNDWGTFSHGTSVEDKDTTLEPFFKDSKTSFWKADDTRSTKTFGYVYPETQDWIVKTRKQLIDKLDKMYPAGSAATLISRRNGLADDTVTDIEVRAKVHIQVEKTQLQATTFQQIAEPVSIQAVALPKSRSVEDIAPDNKYLEWLVDIKAEKHTLGGQYTVHIFLGVPDDSNPYLYAASPMHVGFFAPFGQPMETGCKKCQKDQAAHLKITSQIPLTIALLERYLAGQIESLRPEHVVPFLQEHLHWRVLNEEGVLTERDNVEGLLVAVVSNEVTIPEDPSALPIYAPEVTPWPRITTKEDGVTPRGDGTGLTPAQVS